MGVYYYWAGKNAAEASASMGEIMLKQEMVEERARKEKVFRKGNKIIDNLASRVCSEIKWKTQYKAGVEGWGLKADTFKEELLRIAGDTQEVRDFIAKTEKKAEEQYKRAYQEFLSKEPYYQEHAADCGK